MAHGKFAQTLDSFHHVEDGGRIGGTYKWYGLHHGKPGEASVMCSDSNFRRKEAHVPTKRDILKFDHEQKSV